MTTTPASISAKAHDLFISFAGGASGDRDWAFALQVALLFFGDTSRGFVFYDEVRVLCHVVMTE